MLETTFYNAIKDFDRICDNVIQSCEPLTITRDNGENVVLISQTEYDNLLENLYIRSSGANYTQLLESIEEARASRLTTLDPGKGYA